MMFARRPSLLEFFEEPYKVDTRLRASSVRRYRSELNRLNRIIGPIPINRLSVDHFIQFRSEALSEGLQPETIESSMNALRDEMARLCELASIRRLTPKTIRQAGVTAWMSADETSGKLIHGCGLPRIMKHYLGILSILRSAVDRFQWPECMLNDERQRRLF